MKINKIKIIVIVAIFVISSSTTALADNFGNTIEIYKKSPAVQPFFKSAYGYEIGRAHV